MRIPSLLLFALTATALAAAPAAPESIVADQASPAPSASPYPLVGVPIANSTIQAWYDRGDPDREATDLQFYLRRLIWGANGEAQARAEGKSIDVDADTGQVLVRDTPENVDRVRREVNPGLSSLPRSQVLSPGVEAQQITPGTFTLPPSAGSSLLRPHPPRPAEEQAPAYATSNVARRTLQVDDSMTLRDLRITAVDVLGTTDEQQRPRAVLLLETPYDSQELEVAERRSVSFGNYRIRVVEIDLSQTPHVTLEVTYYPGA
jgi:hypothetical protein